MAEGIKIDNLRAFYGKKRALDGVNMELAPGKIIGVMGPNGSGKTTLFNIIAGLSRQDAGEILYPEGAQGGGVRASVAYLPDAMAFPAWMRVRDAFVYYKNMFPDYDEEAARKFSGILELRQEERIAHLSKGAKERVGIALTFSRKAKLFLLDEPLGGVDPVAKERILDAILAMEQEDACILISTQLIRDIERLFDEVYFLGGGQVRLHVDCEQMREQQHKNLEQAYMEVFGHA